MLKKLLLILCCACCCTMTTVAQKKRKQVDTLPELPAHVKLRLNPLALFEPDAGIMIGGEWQYSTKFSVGLDLAYLFLDLGEGGTSISGYKIRPEFRYYFKTRQKTNWFFAAEATYKRVAQDISGEVCSGPGCAYFQRVTYSEIKSIPGGALKIGLLSYFSKQRRGYIECYLGVGFKIISKFQKNYNGPAGSNPADAVRNDVIFFEEGFSPHIPAGVKFGVRL